LECLSLGLYTVQYSNDVYCPRYYTATLSTTAVDYEYNFDKQRKYVFSIDFKGHDSTSNTTNK
jgi:hypothetical protein